VTLDQLSRTRFRLLVEGIDDKFSIAKLMARHGVPYDSRPEGVPFIQECGGFTEALEAFGVALKTGYRRLAIVLDADLNRSDRWNQVKGRLGRLGIDLPAELPSDGFVLRSESMNVGVWLMPDNKEAGMLEDFLGHLISPEDGCWSYAQTVTSEAKKLGAPFNVIHSSKANIHTWLAWQENPGLPFGTALTANCFKTDAPLALRFVTWFREVFPESVGAADPPAAAAPATPTPDFDPFV
jgi:hypothetical protein